MKALLDELEIPRAHLVGQSMGGWPIVGLAMASPERVQSLVLADICAGIYTAEIEQGFTHLAQTWNQIVLDFLAGVRSPS